MSLAVALLSTPLAADPTPSVVPTKPPFDPGPQAGEVLNYLAWGVTAAGVAGLMIIGTQMALQARRGEMGEGASYFRGGLFVMAACVLGACAKPIFEFTIQPFL